MQAGRPEVHPRFSPPFTILGAPQHWMSEEYFSTIVTDTITLFVVHVVINPPKSFRVGRLR